MPTPLRVLVVEDQPADAELMLHELRRAGFDPDWPRVETEPDYLAQLHEDPDIILSDYSMPQFDGMRALHLLRERGLDLPFIVVPGTANEEIAVECMKQGATAWRSGAWALYRTTTPRTARRHGHCGERGRTRFDISGVVAAL